MYKFLFFFLAIFGVLTAQDANQKDKFRIVCLDNSGTEILFKLNMGKYIVGKNSTCSYPEEAKDIVAAGDHRSLNLEGILSLKPTHLVVNDQITGVQENQITAVKSIKLIKLTSKATLETIQEKINLLANTFDAKDAGADLIESIKKDFEVVLKNKEELKEKTPRFLCVYMRGVDSLYMLGNDSGASSLCKFIGINSCYPEENHTVPLNAEAFVKADPDVFIVFISGLKSVGGLEGFLKIPGVALTKAGKNRRVIAIDGSLLSIFGPRTGVAAQKLFDAVHSAEGFVEIQ